jgi:uncharacterized phage-associated protein
MDALKLAHYIIKKYKNISPMKLQKLLYYVKVWGIVSGEDLLDSKFEKWAYGPVNTEVWYSFKKYSNQYIPASIANKVTVPKGKKKTIDFILDCYAPYDAVTLSAMSHEDEPWKKAKQNGIISDKAMKAYYSTLPFAQNFPFDPQKPFYNVQTDLHYAYIFDMNKKDAKSLGVFPSYKAYKKQLTAANKEYDLWFKKLA